MLRFAELELAIGLLACFLRRSLWNSERLKQPLKPRAYKPTVTRLGQAVYVLLYIYVKKLFSLYKFKNSNFNITQSAKFF